MNYTRKNARKGARYLRIVVGCDGAVSVVAPQHVPDAMLATFVHSKAAWIQEKQEHFARREQVRVQRAARRLHEHGIPPFVLPSASAAAFALHKPEALRVVQARVDYFTARYGVTYSRVTIKNQGTRWGSCSARGALAFNYRLLFVPPAVLDYVVVHEVCHLIELNHSDRFWKLVEREVPAYAAYREALSDSL